MQERLPISPLCFAVGKDDFMNYLQPAMGFNSTPVKLDLYGIPTSESTRWKKV
jgi:hypothetical protein